MYLLLESVFVGIYVYFLYRIIGPHYFLLGFFKHFLGYLFGLQFYFCKMRFKTRKLQKNIFIQSILEGICFTLFCNLLLLFLTYPSITVFITGFLFHIFAEYTGLHRFFCKSHSFPF